VLRLSRESPARPLLGATAGGVALLISLLTPLLWTSWRPRRLPWPIESYLDGVHNLSQPQSWLFPVFPWTGFAFAGLAAGFFLLSDWARKREAAVVVLAATGGVGLIYLARWLNARSQLYAVYDFWHTSPNFFLIRVGLLFLTVAAACAWCRWGAGQRGFSPLIQLGKTSLLVYWVHIEFVYGRLSILPKRLVDIRTASFGLLAICVAMVLLSVLRTKRKGRSAELLARVRRPATTS
ncbi:MAG TPA: hypothetical protein VK579_12865, partial [Terriglobales bacterium]|nr:hypothetical protein [Terriglobales bacterium]